MRGADLLAWWCRNGGRAGGRAEVEDEAEWDEVGRLMAVQWLSTGEPWRAGSRGGRGRPDIEEAASGWWRSVEVGVTSEAMLGRRRWSMGGGWWWCGGRWAMVTRTTTTAAAAVVVKWWSRTQVSGQWRAVRAAEDSSGANMREREGQWAGGVPGRGRGPAGWDGLQTGRQLAARPPVGDGA